MVMLRLVIVAVVTVASGQDSQCGQNMKYIQSLLNGIASEQSQSLNAYRQLAIEARAAQDNVVKESNAIRQQLHNVNAELRIVQGAVNEIKQTQKNSADELQNRQAEFLEEFIKTKNKISDDSTKKLLEISDVMLRNIKESLNLMKIYRRQPKAQPEQANINLDEMKKEFEEKADVLMRRHLNIVTEKVMQIEMDSKNILGTVENVHDHCFEIRPQCVDQEEILNRFIEVFDKRSQELEDKLLKGRPALPVVQEPWKAAPQPVECNKLFSISRPSSCAELRKNGVTCDGAYVIYLHPRLGGTMVYCDMTTDGGGWTVIMRRIESGKKATNFNRSWLMYTRGFGNIRTDFWLGNNHIHSLSDQGQTTLRVNLESFDNQVLNLTFEDFSVAGLSDAFRLNVGDEISGRSAFGESFIKHDGMKFSTSDRSNGKEGCAKKHQAGWWFDDCRHALLTAPYYTEDAEREDWQGIQWESWKGTQPLKYAEMRVRPPGFDPEVP